MVFQREWVTQSDNYHPHRMVFQRESVTERDHSHGMVFQREWVPQKEIIRTGMHFKESVSFTRNDILRVGDTERDYLHGVVFQDSVTQSKIIYTEWYFNSQ